MQVIVFPGGKNISIIFVRRVNVIAYRLKFELGLCAVTIACYKKYKDDTAAGKSIYCEARLSHL